MTVLELHPEELLDKATRGTISAEEADRLDVHLTTCVACRFERHARVDFEAAMELDAAMAAKLASLLPRAARPAENVRKLGARAPTKRVGMLVIAAVVAVSAVSVAAWSPMVRALGLAEPARKDPVNAVPSMAPHHAANARPKAPEPPKSEALVEPITEAPVPLDAPVEAPAPFASAPTSTMRDLGHVSSNELYTSSARGERIAPSPPLSTMATTTGEARGYVGVRTGPAMASPPDVTALFREAVRAERSGDSARALALYTEIDRSFPASIEAETARASAGQIFLDRGAPAEALLKFDAYLRGGGERLREEAFVGRASALERLERYADERTAWTSFLEAFPQSPHAARARSRLANIAKP